MDSKDTAMEQLMDIDPISTARQERPLSPADTHTHTHTHTHTQRESHTVGGGGGAV